MKQARARLLIVNDPHPMRIEKDLAEEIGLNESILFLQIEFLISISRNEQDGRIWTYQSLQELHDNYFPWWSLATISRLIKSLQERELLIIGNFNKSGFDRTQWFALNEEGISRLQSVRLQSTPIFQNEKSKSAEWEMDPSKMKNRSHQNETTIPETTTETTTNVAAALKSLGMTGKQQREILTAQPDTTVEQVTAWSSFRDSPPAWCAKPEAYIYHRLLANDPAPSAAASSNGHKRLSTAEINDLLRTNPGKYDQLMRGM
jgi:hypothetical protein